MGMITAWSYSRYSLWAQCPAKYDYQNNKKLPQPQSPQMARGDMMHKATAKFLLGTAPGLPTEVMQHQRVVNIIQEIKAFPDKVVEQQWGFTNQWKETGWFGNATWFRQVLDVGLLYEDLTAECVDWKSGKEYGDNSEQMELQALSVMHKYSACKDVTTRLVYFDSGSEIFDEYKGADKAKLTAKWEAKVQPMFADTTFIARPNDKCKFCHYRRSNNGPCKFG